MTEQDINFDTFRCPNLPQCTNWISAMRKRKSTRIYRHYIELPLPEIQNFLDEISKTSGPFGTQTQYFISDHGIGDFYILGESKFYYGFIPLDALSDSWKPGLVDYGYSIEKMILKSTLLGLATLWVGGTFPERKNIHNYDTKTHKVAALIPVGNYPVKKTIMSSFINWIFHLFGGDKRYDESTFFYYDNFSNPLTYPIIKKDEINSSDHFSTSARTLFDDSDRQSILKLKTCLEAVRWAPSAKNSQTTRLVVRIENEKIKIHFFAYGFSRYYKYLDNGISMCHWDLATQHFGVKGSFTRENVPDDLVTSFMAYVTTWIPEEK